MSPGPEAAIEHRPVVTRDSGIGELICELCRTVYPVDSASLLVEAAGEAPPERVN